MKNMYDYVIGDRVRLNEQSMREGYCGVICDIREPSDSFKAHLYGIRIDEPVGRHDCNGNCEDKHGWYSRRNAIDLIEPVNDIDLLWILSNE